MSSAADQRNILETELSSLSAELIEAFMQSDPASYSGIEAQQLLKSYIKHITRCGLAAGRTGLCDLQDYCVQFQDILKALLDDPDKAISEYHTVLEQWPLLVLSYLNTDATQDFSQQIQHLIDDTQWPSRQVASDHFSAESAMLLPATEELANGATQYPVRPLDQEETAGSHESLQLAFTEAMQGLFDLYRSDASTKAQRFQEYLQVTADRVELFGISAASAGLLGLMDAAQILQSSLRARAIEGLAFDVQEWHELLTLKTAFIDYLKAGQLPESIDNLIFSLRHLTIDKPLTEPELNTLRDLLSMQDEDTEPENVEHEEIEQDTVNTTLNVDSAHATEDVATQYRELELRQSLSEQSRELLQLIAVEFEQVIPELAANLQNLSEQAVKPDMRKQAAASYTGMLTRFSGVIESIGLSGLSELFARISVYIENNDPNVAIDAEQAMWLAEWPAYLINYLADPIVAAHELASHCMAEHNILGMDAAESAGFVESLNNPNLSLDDEEVEPRQTEARTSDVSLSLPEDVNQQLLDSLLQELPHQTAEFSRVIANIVAGTGGLNDVDTAQRVAHTLKGSANTVGVAGIANLTHHIEDILLVFAKRKQLPTKPLTTILQDAADVLEMMSETLLGQGNVSEQQSLFVLQQILDWANQIDLHGLPEDSDVDVPERPSVESAENRLMPAGKDEAETSLRISMQSVDETLRLVGESIIVNSQLQESLRRGMLHNKTIHAQSDMFQQLAFELEQLVDVRGMNTFLANISNTKFDTLEMDQYNELHTLTRRLVEAATDSRELTMSAEDELKNLEGLILQQDRITKDTQDVVMKTRMLPVQSIVPRLQRSVRQACRLTNKEVELVITGEDTLIDNDILNSLADPLMHVLRNAVDHGIELPEQRLLKGKSSNGIINLHFSREGEYILIRCQDDGAGLDHKAIRQAAIKTGLIRADDTLTNEEISRLILVAGLTTRKETTQMSGRGIGMDAVYTEINNMKGSVRIESWPQDGTLIELQLPVTLITMHGILALARDQVVAISNRKVVQIIHADAGSVSQENSQYYYNYEDERYKAFYLEDLLGLMRLEQESAEIKRPALLYEGDDGKRLVILVEKIITTQDIVIKKLGQYLPDIPGVEGATILGDGSVASVIDLTGILSEFQQDDYEPLIERSDITGIQSGTPKVLVVDDSLSARRSLAEFMRDSGYRVFVARDGIDAIEQLDAHSPDILLVDMEMPRMNGLELTAYIRANAATHNLPVVMITSRATDKHRLEANKAGVNAYLVKPYSEDEVLDKVEMQLTKAFAKQELIAS